MAQIVAMQFKGKIMNRLFANILEAWGWADRQCQSMGQLPSRGMEWMAGGIMRWVTSFDTGHHHRQSSPHWEEFEQHERDYDPMHPFRMDGQAGPF
jgi:hypothetical protein